MYVKKIIDIAEAKKIIEYGKIIFVTERDRNTKKTSNMVAYSYWSGCPLIVRSRNIKKVLQSEYELGKYIKIYSVSELSCASNTMEHHKKMLVDDVPYSSYARIKAFHPNVEFSGFVYDE